MKVAIKKLNVIRILLLVIALMLIAYRFNIYSMPFGGCDFIGFFTIQPGCTSWPYFGFGMAIVFIFFIVRPKSKVLVTIGLALTVLVGMLGGYSGLIEGGFKEIFNDLSQLARYWKFDGFPMILGGLSGYLFIMLLKKKVFNQ